MRVVNRLSAPGGIRRVDLESDTVRVQTDSGQIRIYRLMTTIGKEARNVQGGRFIGSNGEIQEQRF